tara:strand:- start:3185 stop:5803 length:2619 start_codon:yes stop_codon:yes gene_type:complete
MTLEDFFKDFSTKPGGITNSGRAFIEKVFHPVYGDYGLDFIHPEVDFRTQKASRRIDFVVKTPYKHYLLEIDESSHHNNAEAFAKHTEKMRDIRMSLEEGVYECELIDKNLDTKPVLENYAIHEIDNNPELPTDALGRLFRADEFLNLQRYSKIGGPVQLYSFQEDTLDKINKSRDSGAKKGLISLTTGIGKTFISIFHAKHYGGKVLFLAHLKDILDKDAAQGSFAQAWPEISDQIGIVDGDNKDLDKQITIATMQSFSKEKIYEQLSKGHFNTIIIDECHHASTASYKKIIDYFKPNFLLGMTATPTRTDMKDVTELFDNNMIHEITRELATKKGWICGYEYRMLRDNVDYSNIVWNGSRYEEKDLNEKLMVEKRDRAILQEYNDFLKINGNPIKTIGFCHSIEYAEYIADKFSKDGHKAKAIHSNKNYLEANERAIITQAFRDNEINIVFTVNIFNEGVDFPDVECLLMLRPTESHVIMSQQLGRGLRIAPAKEKVSVIDFISNDRRLIEKFEFLGFGKKPKKEKDIYYYDNDGNKVIFDEEIFQNYERLIEIENEIAAKTKPIDMSKISKKWLDYGDVLKEYYVNNYYWNCGKQEKDIPMGLSYVELLEENKGSLGDATKEDILIKGNLISTSHTNNRVVNRAKILGFIRGNARQRIFSEPFYKAKSLCASNWKNIESYQEILEDQLQKICFHGPENSDTNKHGNTEGRKRPSEIFSIFYFMYLYKILLQVGKKTGDFSITMNEFNSFVVTSSNHFDFNDKTNLIIDLRDEDAENKKEIEKWFVQIAKGDDPKQSNFDTRISTLFEYSKHLNFKDNVISLKRESISEIYDLIHNFEIMLEDGMVTPYSENPDAYEEMLCTIGTPWQKS